MYMLAGGGEEGSRTMGAGAGSRSRKQDDDRRPSGAGDIYHPLHAIQKRQKIGARQPETDPPHRAEGVSATSRARVHPT